MKRAFAGVYDPRASGERSRREAELARALESDGRAQLFDDGPLAMAWTGPAESAIADPERPFCLLDGHIYNLGEIAELADAPLSATPEPVLLAAYERWGELMLEQLRGEFVVVVWDPGRQRLLVARDQVNARSVYLHAVGSRVVFGSEIRNVLRLLPRRPAPDAASVPHWLLHSRVPPDRTLYDGISRLEAGHFLRVADGRLEQKRYWAPGHGPPLDGSPSELADQLREQIALAVRRRCPADQTTAVMLSGGLDSSSLAAVAVRTLEPGRAPVGTYSMTFPRHPDSDETPLIDVVAPKLGVPNTRIAVSDTGVLAGSLEYLSTWELPPTAFTLSSWLPLARLAAEDGMTAVLDGENGDDLFGYGPWLVADLVRRGRPIAAAELLRRTPELREASWPNLLRHMYLLGLKGSLPPAVHNAMRRLRGPDDYAPPWLSSQSARAYFDTADYWGWKNLGEPRWWANRAATLITDGFPASLYDHARRRAAMAGLERRHPFADVDLIRFVHRLPPELAVDPRFNRPLLRESMAGLVPDEVRLQPKKFHLDTIFHDSLAADRPTVRRLLGQDARVRAYVRSEALTSELAGAPPTGSAEASRQWHVRVWRLTEIECWLRSQEEPSFAEELLATAPLRKPTYELVRMPAAGGASPAG